MPPTAVVAPAAISNWRLLRSSISLPRSWSSLARSPNATADASRSASTGGERAFATGCAAQQLAAVSLRPSPGHGITQTG